MLVFSNAVSIELVSDLLRSHGLITPDADTEIGRLKDALRELAQASGKDYVSARAQMRRAHKFHSAFLAIGNRQN
jgi:hypothetical protein